MDYTCTLGSLGNSSTAPGRSEPGGTVGPSYTLRWSWGYNSKEVPLALLFRERCTSFHIHSSHLIYFLFFFYLFHSCVPMGKCLGKQSCMS